MVVVKFYRWRFCIVFLQPESVHSPCVRSTAGASRCGCTVYSVQCTEKLARVTLATDLTDWWLVVWRRPAWQHLCTMCGTTDQCGGGAGVWQRAWRLQGRCRGLVTVTRGWPALILSAAAAQAQAAHGQHRGPWPGVLWWPRCDEWHVVTLASGPVCRDWSVTGVCVWSGAGADSDVIV